MARVGIFGVLAALYLIQGVMVGEWLLVAIPYLVVAVDVFER